MNTLENTRRELLHQLQRDLAHERRYRAVGIIGGILFSVAVWVASIVVVLAVL